MKNYELIGLICVASIENDIPMTTAQIAKMAEYLANNGVALEKPVEVDIDVEVEVETDDEPAINNPVEELGISKKNQDKLRHATLDDIVKTKPQSEMDKRMADAYLGEHPNIQPAPVEKKPLSPREKQLWDYMQAHPDARMPSICEALGISNANYYMLKVQLKKKGWIVSAVDNVKAVEL